MDEIGFCGENKEGLYTGIGISITITTDGEENPVVITSNTQNPIYRGGFNFELLNSTPVSDQPYSLNIFKIKIAYTMTSAVSGQVLRFNTTREDQVSGQTIVQSCKLRACIGYSITLCIMFYTQCIHVGRGCLLLIAFYRKNLDLTVSWEHPACCGWDEELDYSVVLECMDCKAAWNQSLSTSLANVSFLSLPTGMYKASVIAWNSCGENISNYTVENHYAGECKILCTCTYTCLLAHMWSYLHSYTHFISQRRTIMPFQTAQGARSLWWPWVSILLYTLCYRYTC